MNPQSNPNHSNNPYGENYDPNFYNPNPVNAYPNQYGPYYNPNLHNEQEYQYQQQQQRHQIFEMQQSNNSQRSRPREDYDDLLPTSKGGNRGGLLNNSRIRLRFVRKVFSLLSVMLTITAIIVGFVGFNLRARLFLKQNPTIILMFSLVGVCLICTLGCIKPIATSVPLNYILLIIFTLSQSIVV